MFTEMVFSQMLSQMSKMRFEMEMFEQHQKLLRLKTDAENRVSDELKAREHEVRCNATLLL